MNPFNISSTPEFLEACKLRYHYVVLANKDQIGIISSSTSMSLTDDAGIIIRKLITDEEAQFYLSEINNHQKILYLDNDNQIKLRDKFSKWDDNTKSWIKDIQQEDKLKANSLINRAVNALTNTITESHYRWNKLTKLEQATQLNYINQLKNIININFTVDQDIPKEPDFIQSTLNYPEERIVAFIDLLGFSNSMNCKDDLIIKNVRDILVKMQNMTKSNSETIKAGNHVMVLPTISAMSDSIIISYPCENCDVNMKLQILATLTGLIVDLAMFVLERGFILRGGITQDTLYHENGYVFGKALVEAYKLESQYAYYPRILFSDKLTNLMKFDETDLCNNQHIRDLDGWYVLNYINPMFSFSVMNKKYYRFIEIINKNIDNLKQESHKKSKWQWLLSQFMRLENSLHGKLLIQQFGI